MDSANSAIGVATSPNMESGTWQDHGETGVNSNMLSPYNAIDPNLIMIGDKPYLNFGSCFNGLQQVDMMDPYGKHPKAEPYQLAYNSTGDHRQEGSFVFEQGGHFFLLFSAGLNNYPALVPLPSGEEYRIVICRSENGTSDFVSHIHLY